VNTDAKRNPESAPGDWFIDRRCINCAAARHVAPGLIIERGDYSVFAREPSTPEEVHQAWLAAELCPTRSIRTESHLRPPDRVYPHRLADGIYLCGHNHRASFGAHSYFVIRDSGNLLVDSPQFTKKLVGPFEEMGGISKVLLSHRDDVADAERWAAHFDADVYIHEDDRSAAPFANHILGGATPAEATDLGHGVLAIPVPGHTKGSVVYLVDEKYLFTGDSLTWSYDRGAMRAFRGACWYSWPTQKKSLTGLASYGFNQVFSGHGPWSPWREQDEMNALLLELTERM
jgi:glyoxylase-like metal-dependent hydrolase (beta-lactamase superfamily II)/ferredoxin